jgi:uncharacterized phage protein gp47/JayE
MIMAELHKLEPCGCCQAPVPPTPEAIWNRPGLPAIDYRVGTFATFRQAMLLAIAGYPQLFDWTARTSDDYGIAIMEMWAYLADILTFYQERIANEAYLRTALHRGSLRRLAALLDYEPVPGMAATAYLAFTVEKEKQVQIPVGLRVQSVPGQDEKPQKFETAEAIGADAVLNQVRIFPRPQSHNPLAKGSGAGTLHPADAALVATELAPGDKLVLFPKGKLVFNPVATDSGRLFGSADMACDYLAAHGLVVGTTASAQTISADSAEMRLIRFFDPAVASWANATGHRRDVGHRLLLREMGRVVGNPVVGPKGVEEKEVESLHQVDGYTDLAWSPGIQGPGWTLGEALMFKWLRKHRLFGYNAPESYLSPTVVAGDPREVHWSEVRAGDKGYRFNLYSGKMLRLDAVYDDLKVGTPILISASDFTQLSEITGVGTLAATHGPVSGTVTQITLAESVQAIDDIRQVTIYVLVEPVAAFWNRRYGSAISGSTVYVPLEELDDLELQRTLILDDGEQQPQTVTALAAAAVDTDGDGQDDHLRISFTPGLERSLDTSTAVLYGNAANATHGETVAGEVLGNGDAAATFQSFSLKKSPVTFVPEASARHGAANTLEIRVGGVLWQEKDTLYDRGGNERVFATTQDDEAVMTARFGDGLTGARLTSGRNNVVSTYRQGLGRDGNVKASTLTTLLDRPTGLKGVTNPGAAQGGAEPEELEEIRTNTPNTVRTFDRIVSLRDFEDAAREYAGIAKARACCVWAGEQRVVELTVAGDEGAPVVGDFRKSLRTYLDARRDPNRTLQVRTYQPVPVEIKAKIQVNPAYLDADVQEAAHEALLDHLAFDNRDLGQAVHLSDIYDVLQEVEGVVSVDVDRLQFKDLADRASHGATADPVQGRLRLEPPELAVIEDPVTDARVEIG